jgi:solute carrier family 10 (sodium/bile acid cotransporter), member 7
MLKRLSIDPFTLILIAVVLLATLLPARGGFAEAVGYLTKAAIVLLFAMHGAKLSRAAIVQGIGAWKLQLMTLSGTFLLFPAIGLLAQLIPDAVIAPSIKAGLLFLCLLPSTVQSSIAFTSIAEGNVAASVCAASLSNVVGIFVTPLLAGLLFAGFVGGGHGPDIGSALVTVSLTLLLPFVLGHLSRPITGAFVDRHKAMLSKLDRGSILLVVYSAFSEAVVEGLWHRVSGRDLATILIADALLLAIALLTMRGVAKLAGLPRADEVTLVFCGSKKSLASGVPMAAAIFPSAMIGVMILPLMMFHQIQLMVCAVLARRYKRKAELEAEAAAPPLAAASA